MDKILVEWKGEFKNRPLLQARASNLPHEGTRERSFYLATAERDVDILQILRYEGAIVLADLMDDPVFVGEHLDWVGFPDWFAYLDQLICVKARHLGIANVGVLWKHYQPTDRRGET